MGRIRSFILLAGGSWLLAYFLDPSSGRRRRAVARDRSRASIRKARRQLSRRGRMASGKLHGVAHQLDVTGEQPPADDVTLARKIETIIFRDADVPKGSINVMAVDGVVELRGEADTPGMIRELERKTAAVAGVREVTNLLHLPDTPPPAPPR